MSAALSLPSVEHLARTVEIEGARVAELTEEYRRGCLDGLSPDHLAGIQAASSAAKMSHYSALIAHFAAVSS